MVAIRCAYICSFEPVSRPRFQCPLDNESFVLAPKKKLAISKQKDGLQWHHRWRPRIAIKGKNHIVYEVRTPYILCFCALSWPDFASILAHASRSRWSD